MRYTFTLPLLFILFISSCTQKDDESTLNKKEKLRQQMSHIDTLVTHDELSSEDIVVTENEDKRLIQSEDEVPKAKLDTTFTIWRNKQGTVKRAAVYPYSKSGDWTAAFLHYFDDQGNTFAFRQSISFFGSYCDDVSGSEFMINEEIYWYYDSGFTQIDSTYSMTGAGGQAIDPDSCKNPYQYFEFTPSSNLSDYLRRIQYESVKENP